MTCGGARGEFGVKTGPLVDELMVCCSQTWRSEWLLPFLSTSPNGFIAQICSHHGPSCPVSFFVLNLIHLAVISYQRQEFNYRGRNRGCVPRRAERAPASTSWIGACVRKSRCSSDGHGWETPELASPSLEMQQNLKISYMYSFEITRKPRAHVSSTEFCCLVPRYRQAAEKIPHESKGAVRVHTETAIMPPLKCWPVTLLWLALNLRRPRRIDLLYLYFGPYMSANRISIAMTAAPEKG